MSLPSGTRLGPYEIVAALGAGGMGDVYRARDTRLGRDVALKVLSSHLASNADARSRFEREARAASSLNHAHICTLHDIGRERPSMVSGQAPAGPEIDFLVMELIEGETLSARLERGPLAIPELLRLGAQIADALDKAHRRGLVHRDLKPANVMLTKSGGSLQAKLLDFGLAKALAQPAAQSSVTLTKGLTQEGTILGTVHYMAPEQLDGHEADARSDIWAFGVTLYEMATARRAFDAAATASLIGAILRDEPPSLAQHQPLTPPALERIVRQCLQKDPDERWQSAADLKHELEWIAAASPMPATPVTVASRSRTRKAGYAAAALVAAAGIGAAGWWAGRSASGADVARWEQFTQLTDLSGEEKWPSVSADGASIAYASEAAGSWDIYAQRVGGRNRILVAGDPAKAETAPAFSPDGTSIAFHESDTAGGIFITGATGESARRLTDFGFHPSWSPDGKHVAFCTEEIVSPYSRASLSQLWVVPVADGEPKKIHDGDAAQPVWSPTGRRIAFWSSVDGQRDLMTVSATGGEAVAVTSDAALDWSPAWGADGHLYFASDRGGPMNIWRTRVNESSGQPVGDFEAVTSGVQAALMSPALTADGSRLVFSSQVMFVNPVAIPFDPVREQLGTPAQVLRRTGILAPTGVSPDGQWLSLSNLGERQEDIFICRTDGSDLRRLTDDVHRDRVPVWSSDGGRLAFYSNRTGTFEIWTIGRDGGGLRLLSRNGGAFSPTYSPDGRRMVISRRGTPRRQFIIPADGQWNGEEGELEGTAVEDKIITVISWSPDGQLLAGGMWSRGVGAIGERPLGIYDIAAKRTRQIDVKMDWMTVRWLPDARRIIGVRTNGQIVVVDTVSGGSRTLTPLVSIAPSYAAFAVSPDGRVLYAAGKHVESDIWMVQTSR